MTSGGIRIKAWVATICALFAGAAWANPEPGQLNMTRGVTEWSSEPYFLNNVALGVCIVIGIVVFGAMFVAMFRFRKSRGAVAEKWSHNTTLEVVWTTIPVIILIVLAYLATGGLKSFADTTNSQMTVKVTGFQWKWRYDYVEYQGKALDKVGFMSKLDKESDETRQLKSGLDPNAVKVDGYNTYLINVDEPLVVPVGTKIRFVITAGDVIHSWWVPALGWKMDAIPGIVNAAWTNIKEPGVYRGQCAELCGQDHGFMPIVVKAVPKAEFEQWLAQKQQAAQPQPPAQQQPAAPAPASSSAAPKTAQAAAPATSHQG
ncbi:cytochrome c oxidase subunit II [Dyella marensis]|uniref:Cytochrome c oxidase subunit 2 n=1 Tax=Dyella marensis TaxID=500610 RepID=A0A1I2EUD8_9GAMM|nr:MULTISPECIES: cytochrome c oxidase subunit II [Dyella]SFE96702.1 cytochrome c oxidase subunit 2 [Dyella marensis]